MTTENDLLSHVEDLVSQATPPPLNLKGQGWRHVNPKFSMIARTFISLVRDEAVLARLERAQRLEDLKALLVVDEYLARVKHVENRRQIQELLEDPEVGLEMIQAFAALSYLKEAFLQGDEEIIADVKAEAERLVYTAEGAARHLGWHTEEVYDAIARGDIQAALCVRLTELLRVRKCGDALRQAGGGRTAVGPDDPSAQPP